jgi:hypothetical protein
MARLPVDVPNDFDESDDRGSVPFPGIVKAAGIIWIGVGALSIINMMVTFAMIGANGPRGNAAGANAGGANPATPCCAGLVGIAFLVCGHQTVTGKAKDTLGNGVGSMILGSLQLLGAAAIGVGGVLAGQNGGQQGPPAGMMLVIAGMVGVMGCILILAGILALAGRSAYREWRYENALQPRRRRQRREDDEEEDNDRPRRRRREEDDEDERPWKKGREGDK